MKRTIWLQMNRSKKLKARISQLTPQLGEAAGQSYQERAFGLKGNEMQSSMEIKERSIATAA